MSSGFGCMQALPMTLRFSCRMARIRARSKCRTILTLRGCVFEVWLYANNANLVPGFLAPFIVFAHGSSVERFRSTPRIGSAGVCVVSSGVNSRGAGMSPLGVGFPNGGGDAVDPPVAPAKPRAHALETSSPHVSSRRAACIRAGANCRVILVGAVVYLSFGCMQTFQMNAPFLVVLHAFAQ